MIRTQLDSDILGAVRYAPGEPFVRCRELGTRERVRARIPVEGHLSAGLAEDSGESLGLVRWRDGIATPGSD